MLIKYQDLDQVAVPSEPHTARIRAYIVPEALSADRYYISMTSPGHVEIAPPSRSRDTLKVLDLRRGEGDTQIIFKHDNLEVTNA